MKSTILQYAVAARDRLEEGSDAICQWLFSNCLKKLNPDRTEIMWCSTAKRCGFFQELSLSAMLHFNQPILSVIWEFR